MSANLLMLLMLRGTGSVLKKCCAIIEQVSNIVNYNFKAFVLIHVKYLTDLSTNLIQSHLAPTERQVLNRKQNIICDLTLNISLWNTL